eukprot:TRINITY_DN112505_c0_g1_i1.p1 TRINITY_DN112505_c0_g1~~TRINITY_DN112505_c0_g1_i1.p1  ORF type:complete len:306 (+),score=48.80 TRINITY_DN112505_c0_g1_i1:51-968(+)
MGQALKALDPEACSCSPGSAKIQVISHPSHSSKDTICSSKSPTANSNDLFRGGIDICGCSESSGFILKPVCTLLVHPISGVSGQGRVLSDGLIALRPMFKDIEDMDHEKSKVAVRCFIACMLQGVRLHLCIEGLDPLDVDASLDSQCSQLLLTFNGVEKMIPLAEVRDIQVQPPAKAKVLEENYEVRLQLEDGHFCTFTFPRGAESKLEAVFFSSCLRVLCEAARFEAVRTELSQGSNISLASPPQEVSSAGSASARSTTQVSQDVMEPAMLVAALHKAFGCRSSEDQQMYFGDELADKSHRTDL